MAVASRQEQLRNCIAWNRGCLARIHEPFIEGEIEEERKRNAARLQSNIDALEAQLGGSNG